MIENATLLRIDAPPALAGGGDLAAYTNGPALSVRCCLDEPTFVLQRLIDQMMLNSTAVLYVELATMPTAGEVLLRNAQVYLQLDGQDAQTLWIDQARKMVNGGVSHVQCFLRSA